MHDFHYIDGELICENVKVSDIASQSKTPFYLYSRKTISDHYRKLNEAFSSIPHLICYSLKANSNIALMKLLAEMGAGADVTSGGELFKALLSGIAPGKIVYAGVGKTQDEITYAINKGILMFNVESIQELNLINEIAGRMKKKAVAAIRVNPDVEVETHAYIRTGKSENKFGLTIDMADNIFRKRDSFPNIEIEGIHLHIGSQITDVTPYIESIKKVAGFIDTLNFELKWFDIGGGLGIIYRDEKPSTAEEFAQAVIPLVKGRGCKIILEPGRFIVGNAGILVTKVLYIKESGSRTFIVVDSGMNDLIRPSLYGAYHEIKPVRMGDSKEIPADIVGPICETGDFFARDRKIPEVKQGDFLAVFSAGAYGFSMASNYNSRPRSSEFLVEGDKFRLIREREQYEDLVRGEIK
jgi:diaminopimelate decarboxylase